MKTKLLKELVKPMGMKKLYSLPEDELIELIKRDWRIDDVPDFLYKMFKVSKTFTDGRPVFKIEPKGGASDRVIVFIHGGGGMLCPTIFHFHTAARLVRNTGAALYMPFYPLAPEHTLPEACAWLDKAYEDITSRHSPKNIAVIGDSAGVSLGVSMCERSGKKPSAMVIISPGAGIEKNDEKMRALEKKDVIISCRMVDIIKKYWSGEMSADDSAYNSAYTDFTGFPPILLYYGTNEIFYAYIGDVINEIRRFDIPLEIHEGKGLFHDWAIVGMLPEGKQAQNRICRFILENTEG
ncbi:MAG: alpha/beta hydrolase [Firmicutes bacterium]|nr:alpha/beta hydrolase [Bacillota bacterium]